MDMRKMRMILVAMLIAVGVVGLIGVGNTSVMGATCGGVETSLIGCEDPGDGSGGAIWAILRIVVQILTYSIVTLAIIGIIISGIQYSTAGDSSDKITQAKKRIFNIIIGVVVYALIALITEFLIPGGVFR